MLNPNTDAQTPIACALSFGSGIAFTTIASATGLSIEAPTPWRARAATSTPADGASLGERDFTLRPGEVAEFDTTEPHWFGPADSRPVEILHLFGPRGDQAVVRAGPSTTGRVAPTDPAPPSTAS
ncbi:hypothetical protein [Streptomyces torulosus]|uniref:hypothetical protein n=1 Tax=Streptomyces torulosus TaxID=68276 RepID=UPI003B82FAC5